MPSNDQRLTLTGDALDNVVDLLGNAHPDTYNSIINRAGAATSAPVMAGLVPRPASRLMGSVPALPTAPAGPEQVGIPLRGRMLGAVPSAPSPDIPSRPMADPSMNIQPVAQGVTPSRGVLGKVGNVLGTVGKIAASALIPGVAPWIPGTDQHNIMEERLREGQAQAGAELGKTQADVADIGAKTREQNAEAALKEQEFNTPLAGPKPLSLDEQEAKMVQDEIAKGTHPNDALAQVYAAREAGKPAKTIPAGSIEQQVLEAEKMLGDPNATAEQKTGAQRTIDAAKASGQVIARPGTETFTEKTFEEWSQTHPGGTRLQFEAERKKDTEKPATEAGTWSLQEDAQGNSVLMNSKTGETKPATGVVPRGTAAKKQTDFEKNVAPVEGARQYAQDYVKNGAFTGPGDEALQEKFFELAKPSTGFRMTQPQMQMLQDSRGWMSGAEARLRHATTGTWFSDEQRKQIAKTMDDLADAKAKSLKGGGSTEAPQRPKGVPADAHWDAEHRLWMPGSK